MKSWLKTVSISLVGGALTACASPVGPEHWTGGASAQQVARDEYECDRDAQAAHAGIGWTPSAQTLYEKCMAAKGYTRR